MTILGLVFDVSVATKLDENKVDVWSLVRSVRPCRSLISALCMASLVRICEWVDQPVSTNASD